MALNKAFPTEFEILPDPVVRPFATRVRAFRSSDYSVLTIDAENVYADVVGSGDVRVSVGVAPCNGTVVTPTQITCRPPIQRPDPLDPEGLLP